MKTLQMSSEDFTKTIGDAYSRRQFILPDLMGYLPHLTDMEAFALSRLLPKEIRDRVLKERAGLTFGDKVVDHYLTISKNGPILELQNTKKAEETFLATRAMELVTVLTSR